MAQLKNVENNYKVENSETKLFLNSKYHTNAYENEGFSMKEYAEQNR